jgi:hypothetical protein
MWFFIGVAFIFARAMGDGTYVPLQCEEFDVKNTSCNDPLKCTYVHDCAPLDSAKTSTHRPACMAVKRGTQIHMKACWSWEAASPCDSTADCVARVPDPLTPDSVVFCCCTQSLCNSRVRVEKERKFRCTFHTLCTAATSGAHGIFPPAVLDSKTTLVHIVSYTLIPLVMLTMFIVTVYFCIRRYQYGELKHKHMQADVVQSTMPVVSMAANGERLLVVAPPYSAHRPLLSSIGSIANVQKIEVGTVCMHRRLHTCPDGCQGPFRQCMERIGAGRHFCRR